MTDAPNSQSKNIQDQTIEEWTSAFEGRQEPSRRSAFSKITQMPIEEDEDYGVEGELPELIPEGIYRARFVFHETRANMFGTGKLRLVLEVLNEGEFKGVHLDRWYNVTIKGKPGLGGRFTVKARSDYRHEYLKVFEDADGKRRDRLSPRNLIGIELLIEVKTVKKDRNGERTAAGSHYSKVQRIIGKA